MRAGCTRLGRPRAAALASPSRDSSRTPGRIKGFGFSRECLRRFRQDKRVLPEPEHLHIGGLLTKTVTPELAQPFLRKIGTMNINASNVERRYYLDRSTCGEAIVTAVGLNGR